LTTIYPSFDSPEYVAAVATLREQLQVAQAEILRIATPDTMGVPIDDGVIATYEAWIGQQSAATKLAEQVMSFVSLNISVNSRDTVAQGEHSKLLNMFATWSKIDTRFTAWLGSLDVETLIEHSDVAKDHAFLLRRAKIDAQHLMDQAEEDLAAELTLSGGSAWGRLHDDLTSQIEVPFERQPGDVAHLPMSEIRNLAMDPDREVRRRAFEAELAAWKQWETPIAASLNGVKGEHATLARRRNWPEVLDQSLHQNHIDHKTLDAMFQAARKAYPDIRRYLKAKAKALGVERLAWYDLSAPLSANEKEWPWEEGVNFVLEQFGSFSPRMRALAQRAIDERWIDAEPRAGKVGGAFCYGVHDDVSRILSNYAPTYDGVSTLAHELGHAYHNLAQSGRPILQVTATPNTLAETASTFCETILRKAAVVNSTPDEALAILEGELQDVTQTVVDISSRFLFEQAVFAQRKERELAAGEFNELMLQAQRETYGDGLDPEELHPYMWAVKGHYYSANFAYYNYPYMFGLLFGLGLYAAYEKDPDSFRASYDELLASTGEADAATLAARFGIDTQSEAFWTSSLDIVRADIDTFVSLIDQRTA
jgi:pepF/M3 family oligoendopeptidase